jgi:hypothetical protein
MEYGRSVRQIPMNGRERWMCYAMVGWWLAHEGWFRIAWDAWWHVRRPSSPRPRHASDPAVLDLLERPPLLGIDRNPAMIDVEAAPIVETEAEVSTRAEVDAAAESDAAAGKPRVEAGSSRGGNRKRH